MSSSVWVRTSAPRQNPLEATWKHGLLGDLPGGTSTTRQAQAGIRSSTLILGLVILGPRLVILGLVFSLALVLSTTPRPLSKS